MPTMPALAPLYPAPPYEYRGRIWWSPSGKVTSRPTCCLPGSIVQRLGHAPWCSPSTPTPPSVPTVRLSCSRQPYGTASTACSVP